MFSARISKVYCSIVIVVSIAMLAGISITSSLALLSLGVAVTVMGLPHGALDFTIAKMLGYCANKTKTSIFILTYSGIAAGAVLFWLWLPAYALTVFLLISAHHFSSDWEQLLPYSARFSLAVILLCAPSLLYAAILQHIFVMLMLSPAAALIVIKGMQTATLISIGILVVNLALKLHDIKWQSVWESMEICVLLVSSLLLTPLLHFALYFCLLHSTKHFSHTTLTLKLTLYRAVWLSLPFVIATLLAAALIAQIKTTPFITADILQYVFIGLFGLTVSHMLLIETWQAVKTSTR
ncbi:beta-carotene 15,15'-dioxygenase, Brp/Blh family [Alishewanella tabrizica]|uniref:Beta-carotene 15,15'-dioxygenase n=1 Tax=Alishewanella tabrizica TaxID=671278 RepID=A0ABQ2WEH6_9ALTE|nr:beta-carotene 15,15'-dioxygenase, Brp/Blh family [Alishewanella tabrizica]GGW51881.1 hypothetical protein GCM10008111_04710 [Alishewanella tabrizica]